MAGSASNSDAATRRDTHMNLICSKSLQAMPLAALMAVSVLTGCGSKKTDDTMPAPAAAPASPGGPIASTPGTNPDTSTPGTASGGPGGSMKNKPSMNPHGGAAGDGLITLKVKNALIASKIASGINVDTKSGTVVLRGSVKTAADKATAIADSKKISGVHNVLDQLAVKP